MSDEKKEGITQGTEGGTTPPGTGNGTPGSGGGKSRFFLVLSAILGLLLAGVVAFYNVPAFHVFLHPHPVGDNAAKTADQYTCGMHPFILSDKPGNCPICGMKLTKIEGSPAQGGAAATSPTPAGQPSESARKILFYRNQMNPNVTSQTPAKDEMGMDFVPVYEDEAKGTGGGNLPEGYATVQVGMERVQLAGIQSATAVRATISHPVRAAGVVVADETRVRRVQSKVDGWIEKLHSNFTGQLVTKGQPLLEIYSPDLVAAQREFLLAKAGVNRMKESPYEDARRMSSELAQAARTRLKLFDVPESFIEELERTGKVRRTVTLNAPVSGYVRQGGLEDRVMPGMDPLTVTDLSRVWIEADLSNTRRRPCASGNSRARDGGDPGRS
jgi:Cu(I)/Ag(I) efflux system membrane fusion protein/cobalt-zinc-cadmium efflux system membrane fusion protein